MGVAFIIGCVPPILLLVYIWYLDRKEHEPVGLVAGVFVFSALLGTTIAGILEGIGQQLLGATNLLYIPVLGGAIFYFCVVAVAEEFCKRLPVMALVWRNKAFNYSFDAVVYCVASAIGFAVAENVMYIVYFGADVAVARLIPVHAICGVFMGYFLGCAKMCQMGGNVSACRRYRVFSLLIPVIIHGAWDFLVTTEWSFAPIVALVCIIALTAYAWRRLHLYAKYDVAYFQTSGS